MIDDKQAPVANQQYPQQFSALFQTNGGIDLRELCKALWSGKWVIIAFTLVFSIGAIIFAFNQLNIYQSQSSFSVDNNFYESRDATLNFISDTELKKVILSGIIGNESKLKDVTLSYNPSVGTILISKISHDPQEAFDGVTLFANALNKALKINELDKVNVSIQALNGQTQKISEKTKEVLDELLAQQIYKKALLENPNSKLVRQISAPAKPVSHIKPNRELIVTLGALCGGILGAIIVLVRFNLCREDDEFDR